MPSKRLMGFWAFMDIALLAAGAIMVAFSQIFNQPNLLINIALRPNFILGGLVAGIFFLITWVFSIGAIVQGNHVTRPLTILNWILVVDALVILIVGSIMWIFSLEERANYLVVYKGLTEQQRITIQDEFSCCGWFTPNDTVTIGGSFCTNLTFANSLVDPTNTDAHRCVAPITKSADYTLNNVFTTIYGFMAVVFGLFLATMCVIKRREEEERFKKIDAKRGGRGFV